MMPRIMQPGQPKDSYDSNPKATSKPSHKTLRKTSKQPDASTAGRASTASGSCKSRPNGSRNSFPCKRV